MAQWANILWSVEDGVATITINRPAVLNALSAATRREVAEAFRAAAAAEEVGVVVLTGAGERAFCAGQDLNEAVGQAPEDVQGWIDTYHDLYDAIRACPKPTVAAVAGWSTGAGLQIALLCDFRVASDTAKLAMTELNVGLGCITGTTLLLPLVGAARAAQVALACDVIDAPTALRWGLVARVWPAATFRQETAAFARGLAKKAPTAYRVTKAWLNALTREAYERGLAQVVPAQAEVYASGEPARYMGAFLAGRKTG